MISLPNFVERLVQLCAEVLVRLHALIKKRAGELGKRRVVVALEFLYVGGGEWSSTDRPWRQETRGRKVREKTPTVLDKPRLLKSLLALARKGAA